MKMNNRITIYFGSGSALDLVFAQVAKKKNHDHIKHLLALGVASFYNQEVVNKKDATEAAMAAFAALNKRSFPQVQTVPKGAPIEGQAVVVDHGNHLHILPTSDGTGIQESAPVSSGAMLADVDENVAQESDANQSSNSDTVHHITAWAEFVLSLPESVQAKIKEIEPLDLSTLLPTPEKQAAQEERRKHWKELIAQALEARKKGEQPFQEAIDNL